MLIRSTGRLNSAFWVNSPVIIWCELQTALLRPRVINPSVFAPDVVTRSPPIIASASPTATRIAEMSSGLFATRQWICTAPPFWASPAISIIPTPLPSRCAAIPSNAPTVTTPVPPTPVITMLWVPLMVGSVGSGKVGKTSSAFSGFFTCAPSSVTKLGQKPLRQEKSLLQEDWSISRLRPSTVSSGRMETQFDCTPQSPQPSQTSGLMNTRLSGSGNRPRFRRRRFSAAHVWI